MFLADAVGDWAHGRDRTNVDAVGDLVGFTVCDPGAGARGPSSSRFAAAVALLKIRMSITVGAANDGAAGDVARCFARTFVAAPGAEALLLSIGAAPPRPAQRNRIGQIQSASVAACRADSDAGLP